MSEKTSNNPLPHRESAVPHLAAPPDPAVPRLTVTLFGSIIETLQLPRIILEDLAARAETVGFGVRREVRWDDRRAYVRTNKATALDDVEEAILRHPGSTRVELAEHLWGAPVDDDAKRRNLNRLAVAVHRLRRFATELGPPPRVVVRWSRGVARLYPADAPSNRALDARRRLLAPPDGVTPPVPGEPTLEALRAAGAALLRAVLDLAPRDLADLRRTDPGALTDYAAAVLAAARAADDSAEPPTDPWSPLDDAAGRGVETGRSGC